MSSPVLRVLGLVLGDSVLHFVAEERNLGVLFGAREIQR